MTIPTMTWQRLKSLTAMNWQGLTLPLALAAALAAMAATPAQAQNYKFKVLHTFHGKDGGSPFGTLVRDAAGNLYGTAGGGTGKCGSLGCGVVFKLDGTGRQVWLYNFQGKNGQGPAAGLLRDAKGNLFGTTAAGGLNEKSCAGGCGVVFRLDRTGRKEAALYKFTGPPDGYWPESTLVEDTAGNLYGTTYEGGADVQGTVFMIDTAGKETILHSFAGPPEGGGDGASPYHGVVRDAAGNLYGVTFAGGEWGAGAVYEVDSSGSEALLYSFSGGSDGAQPDSILLLDAQGNLYGTTQNGGNDQCGGTGCGVVFELSPQSGGGWAEKVLYDFCSQTGCADGEGPIAGPLVMDASGNLYGTTYFGGAYRNCNGDGCGVVFKLDSTGNETVLHSFTGGPDGAFPWAGVTSDRKGNLYGTTVYGGARCDKTYTCGVVFEISPESRAGWAARPLRFRRRPRWPHPQQESSLLLTGVAAPVRFRLNAGRSKGWPD